MQHINCWKDDDDGELMPTWTTTPDLSLIKNLVIQHLSPRLTDIEVEFFAEGALNKLYNVWSPHIPQRYLMRVTLPVEPFFKTESEIATLAYIRTYTSIPVSNVIAYDSNSDNPLGFELMLLEKIDGVPLAEAWERMGFSSKLSLTTELAGYRQQLSGLRFRKTGNLYFSTIQDQVSSRILSSDTEGSQDNIRVHNSAVFDRGNKANDDIGNSIHYSNGTTAIDLGIGSKFVVGRVVSPWFFRDKRVFLPTNRGPFSSSYELMMAKTQIQIERIKHLSPLPTDEYYSETDERLAGDQDEVLNTCYKLKALLPHYFPPSGNAMDINILYHSDLSDRNIIVDPKTYRITGIVDWESVSICPSWEVSEYPNFLQGYEVEEPPPPGDPDIDEEALTFTRRDWEGTLLRKMYRESLDKIGKGLDSIPLHETRSDGEVRYKRFLESLLYKIELRWTKARSWIPYLRSKGFDYIDEFAIGLLT